MSVQLHQNLNLLLLLILGSFFAYLPISFTEIGAVLSFTFIVEHLFLYINRSRTFYISYSALSTAIGVALLVYSSSLWIYFIVITLGLAQKHFLTFANHHFFNPSNFALIITLALFYNDAHLISGALGDEPIFTMVVFVLALSILVRVQRWLIPIAFVFFYLLLQYLLIVLYDPFIFFEMITHRFYSVTFMLFIYFMLTDPAVTPTKWREQLLFVFSIALFATLFDRFYGYRVQHLFMSVFFFSFLFNLFPLKQYSLTQLKYLGTILFLVIGGLVYIELQAPYYFEMNG